MESLFVSFEGTEGSGKSTQLHLLAARLRQAGYTVTENQEPGGTQIGKQIRRVLLDPANTRMAPLTELLLMFASRTQAATEVIRPALARGEIVLSDRFTDSSLAYQGAARGLGAAIVQALHQLALGSLYPDLTLCITVDVPVGLARARRRNQSTISDVTEDRIDQQALAFHMRVAAAYADLAQADPTRFILIDGNADPATVSERVWTHVRPLLDHLQAVSPCE